MRHIHWLALLALFATPAKPATTSIMLRALADRAEAAPARSYAMEKEGLALLREPVLTYNKKTLPSYPSQYMANPETALTLTMPPNWYPASMQLSNTFYNASGVKWPPEGPAYSMWEAGGSSRFSRGGAMYVAILRSWAWHLQFEGR